MRFRCLSPSTTLIFYASYPHHYYTPTPGPGGIILLYYTLYLVRFPQVKQAKNVDASAIILDQLFFCRNQYCSVLSRVQFYDGWRYGFNGLDRFFYYTPDVRKSKLKKYLCYARMA